MPTTQQRTLKDAWLQPNKRRRLDKDSNPNKTKKAKEEKKTTEKPLNARSKPTNKSSFTPNPPTSKPTPISSKQNPNTPITNSPKTTSNPPPSTKPTSTLTLTHQRTSLFSSPPSTLLLHSTNCRGTWGAGIASQFRKLYPSAHTLYQTHCAAQKPHPRSLLGTTLLIRPQTASPSKSERDAKHWIGCLFTSENVGRRKDGKGEILRATRGAVADLARQVGDLGEEGGVGEVRMCKINSGLFGVPWEETREVVESVEVEVGGGVGVREIVVCSLD